MDCAQLQGPRNIRGDGIWAGASGGARPRFAAARRVLGISVGPDA